MKTCAKIRRKVEDRRERRMSWNCLLIYRIIIFCLTYYCCLLLMVDLIFYIVIILSTVEFVHVRTDACGSCSQRLRETRIDRKRTDIVSATVHQFCRFCSSNGCWIANWISFLAQVTRATRYPNTSVTRSSVSNHFVPSESWPMSRRRY